LVGVDLGRHDEHGNNRWGQIRFPLENGSDPSFQMAGSTLDASADNGEDGGWFFRLALHGATHP